MSEITGGRPPRAETEAHFQERVQRAATDRGWGWLHIPRTSVKGGWRTLATGPLAKGWPDLLLVRAGRIMFLELKTNTGSTSEEQRAVHGWLGQAAEVHVLRPRDWERVISLLE